MSQNNNNNTDQTTSLNLVNMCEGTVLENLAKFVDDTLTDMKKCLDKVLDLRGKYNPHIMLYNSHLIQMPRGVLIQWNVKSLNILPLCLYKNQTYKFGQCTVQD
jgi:hypothetical protein